MNWKFREKVVTESNLVVVKVGSRVLTDDAGLLNLDRVEHLAEQIHELRTQNRKVVLVSSGAVAAGIRPMGLTSRPTDLATLQAVAAIGQTKLIEAYDRFFKQHRYIAAQILLTADDLHERSRYLNVRNTLRSILDLGAIPIINENDSVAVEELQATFGDNDRLAALVTNLLAAPLLVVLSDVEGLFDGPPELPTSKLIEYVTNIDDSIMSVALDGKRNLSKGGMQSKLRSARMVTSAGENVILASGHENGILKRIFSGEQIGTFFEAANKSLSPYKRWIGFSVQTKGKVLLDDGASKAVTFKGSSILAIGVTDVLGEFSKGDPIDICDGSGLVIAKGLTNYSSSELYSIRGVRSDKIAEILGHCPYATVVHRDNLMVVE